MEYCRVREEEKRSPGGVLSDSPEFSADPRSLVGHLFMQ